MSRFVDQNPEIGPRPRYDLVAVLGHAAGVHGALEHPVTGETRQELLGAGKLTGGGSRYLSRLYDPATNETVWTNYSGWAEDQDQQS